MVIPSGPVADRTQQADGRELIVKPKDFRAAKVWKSHGKSHRQMMIQKWTLWIYMVNFHEFSWIFHVFICWRVSIRDLLLSHNGSSCCFWMKSSIFLEFGTAVWYWLHILQGRILSCAIGRKEMAAKCSKWLIPILRSLNTNITNLGANCLNFEPFPNLSGWTWLYMIDREIDR